MATQRRGLNVTQEDRDRRAAAKAARDKARADARVEAAVARAVAKQREALGVGRHIGPGADKSSNLDRSRSAARQAANLRQRAELALARGDTQLARNLLDAARRHERTARLFRRRHQLLDAKRSALGEALSAREKQLRARAARLMAAGQTKAAAEVTAEAEAVALRADLAREQEGVPPKRKKSDAESKETAQHHAKRRAAAAEDRAKARAARQAAFEASEEGQSKAKRRRIRAIRARIKERMRQERRKSYGLGHAFAKGRLAEIMAAKRARAFIAKIEERVEADRTAKVAAKKAAHAAPLKKAAKWAYKVATGRDYKRKLSDKEQLAHTHGVEEELAKKSVEINKALREAHAAARAATADLRRAAAARAVRGMRIPGSASERAWADAVHAAEQAKSRVAAAKQARFDHQLRRLAAANVRSAIHNKIEKSIGGKIGRAVGKVKHVLGAPKRKVRAIRSAIAKKFLEFKKKHGIHKPLKPDQRRTLMQKLFGSDKGYRGEAYVAGGMGGIGMMLLTGRAGFLHPDHRAKMRELDEEMRHAHEEVPHVLHKGAKGGIFYYSPEGKKVYITRGGIGGLLSIHKMFKAGRSGARLYR